MPRDYGPIEDEKVRHEYTERLKLELERFITQASLAIPAMPVPCTAREITRKYNSRVCRTGKHLSTLLAEIPSIVEYFDVSTKGTKYILKEVLDGKNLLQVAEIFGDKRAISFYKKYEDFLYLTDDKNAFDMVVDVVNAAPDGPDKNVFVEKVLRRNEEKWGLTFDYMWTEA